MKLYILHSWAFFFLCRQLIYMNCQSQLQQTTILTIFFFFICHRKQVLASCILRHRGVQLILAYNWARPVTLVAGKGRGGMFYFFCFFTFILVRLSYLSLSFISSTISSISFLPFSGRRHKMTHKVWRVVKPQHNQSIKYWHFMWIGRQFTWNVNTFSLKIGKIN